MSSTKKGIEKVLNYVVSVCKLFFEQSLGEVLVFQCSALFRVSLRGRLLRNLSAVVDDDV